jgi:hypothetical protein
MKYYCLIAGLPDIGIDDHKPAFDLAAFREELRPQLSENDNRLIDLFYMKFDNENLLRYLKDREAAFDGRGNTTKDELEECLRMVAEDEKVNSKYFPPYFKTFVEEYREAQQQIDTPKWENRLAELYYRHGMKSDNRLVAKWFEFNLNLNNILAAYASRKYEMDVEAVGDNEVAQSVRSSTQRDLGLTGIVDNIEELQRIADEQDMFEREKKIDLLKWNWLDNETFFEYFSIERVFAYLIKLEIIERWANLDHKEGQRIFRELIDKLKESVVKEKEFI